MGRTNFIDLPAPLFNAKLGLKIESLVFFIISTHDSYCIEEENYTRNKLCNYEIFGHVFNYVTRKKYRNKNVRFYSAVVLIFRSDQSQKIIIHSLLGAL